VFTNVCDSERKIRQNVAFVALQNEYLTHVADSTEWKRLPAKPTNAAAAMGLPTAAGGRDH